MAWLISTHHVMQACLRIVTSEVGGEPWFSSFLHGNAVMAVHVEHLVILIQAYTYITIASLHFETLSVADHKTMLVSLNKLMFVVT